MHTFPALFFSHVYLPRELFGSLYYLNLLWLTTVVTLVLLLRYSLKTKTTTWLTQVFLILPLITDWNILDSWTSVSLTHRAIINHFTPKIDSWAAVNHLTSLSSEQVCWYFLWSECEPFLVPKVRAVCDTCSLWLSTWTESFLFLSIFATSFNYYIDNSSIQR